MKTKLLNSIVHFFMVVAMVLMCFGCAKENTIKSYTSTQTEFFFSWSSASKGDTLIYDCFQSITLDIEGETSTFYPEAQITFSLKQNPITIQQGDDPTPVYKTETSSTSTVGFSPKTYNLTKEFVFNDSEIVYVDAYHESYTLGAEENEVLPFISIKDISYVKSSVTKKSSTEYLADLYFNIVYKNEKTQKEENLEAKISYQKNLSKDDSKPEDTLINTVYNKGIDWKSENQFELYVERIKTWSQTGEDKTLYKSPTLSVNLQARQDKNLTVENFDFTKQISSNEQTRDLSKDGWQITQSEITQQITYTNNIDTFEDTFTYNTYEAGFSLDNQFFEFDLSSVFNLENTLIENSQTQKTNYSKGTLTFATKEFSSDVTTILTLKEETPTPPASDDDTPNHGRILAHFVSAVYSPSGEITKKCVIIRYEEGYEWGVCAYNEYFPTGFTYTQSGYSAFNSVAYDSKEKAYRLARATDESNGIYWRREDNQIISAIDYVSCKSKGWKNSVNGSYSYKMSSYKEEYSNSNYTLTLTAPNGETKTFNSKISN